MRKALNSFSPIKAEETASLLWIPTTFSLSNCLSLYRHNCMYSVGIREWHMPAGGLSTEAQEADLLGRFLKWDCGWMLRSWSPIQLGFPSSMQHTHGWFTRLHFTILPWKAISWTTKLQGCSYSCMQVLSWFIQASQTTFHVFLEMSGTRPLRTSWETV